MKHFIDIHDLSPGDLNQIFQLARDIRSNGSNCLANKSVGLIFEKPSNRTRLSFEIATQKCQATPMMIDVETSSLTKGESLLDMVQNISAMNTDAMIIRHANGGVPHFISQHVPIPVINAGDGYHEHPSQGLLDLFTMTENLGDLNGKHVLILGDIMHSRVAKSNICLGPILKGTVKPFLLSLALLN